MAYVDFTDPSTSEVVRVASWPYWDAASRPLVRFTGWQEVQRSVGPIGRRLSTGAPAHYALRTEYGATFAIPFIRSRALSIAGAGGTVSVSGTTATFSTSQDGWLTIGDTVTVAAGTREVVGRTSGTVWTLASTVTASAAAFTLGIFGRERAARLVAHLAAAGSCTVATADRDSRTYTAVLWDGAEPTLELEDPRAMLARLTLALLRTDAAAPMRCRY